MTMLRPGSDGEPLPAGTLVFRIGKETHLSPAALEQRKALAEMFEPSSVDKRSPGKRLSIWVEELTIADQGWKFMGAKPDKTVVACLDVDSIRAVPPPETFHPLDAEWERALLDDGRANTEPGAEGHAGIAGLLQGGDGKTDRNRRKALRSKLADIADISPVPVPHDIPESEIQVAAYYISEKDDEGGASQEAHWIEAIRQLRRARVRERRQRSREGRAGDSP